MRKGWNYRFKLLGVTRPNQKSFPQAKPTLWTRCALMVETSLTDRRWDVCRVSLEASWGTKYFFVLFCPDLPKKSNMLPEWISHKPTLSHMSITFNNFFFLHSSIIFLYRFNESAHTCSLWCHFLFSLIKPKLTVMMLNEDWLSSQ